MSSQTLANPFYSSFRAAAVVCVCTLAAFLGCFSPKILILFVAMVFTAFVLWMVFTHPVSVVGIVLAFMPFDFMVIALGKFFGLPHMTLVSAGDKEIILLLLAFVLWRQNGFKFATPDLFLIACLMLAVIRTAFDGILVGLVTDFAFVIPYLVGRMTILTTKQEQLGAKWAVWIVGILSVLGLIEVFIVGEGPRTLLYLAIDSETEGGQLTSSFHASGFTGLREAATMIGPNGFGDLCMVALIIWWVYRRNPLPAVMVATGLICSVTRSAWIGTAAAIPLLAIMMRQTKRFFLYATVALSLFAAAIPVLGLSDYIFLNKTGQDLSAEGHKEQIVDGLKYAADHPLGSGNRDLSPMNLKANSNTTILETTYPYLAAAYGIAVAILLIGFLASALHRMWKMHSPLGHAALGILVGTAVVMVSSLPLTDRRLGCWLWFPIGLAVRQSQLLEQR